MNDLQKLLGTINWIRPLLATTTEELSPLSQLLKGDQELSSPWQLTKTAQKALETVSDKINVLCHMSKPRFAFVTVSDSAIFPTLCCYWSM